MSLLSDSAVPLVQRLTWYEHPAHINNLYNTTFWALVHADNADGLGERRAHETLKGTVSSEKNEILFGRFGINYDKLEPMFRKGTTIVWGETTPDEKAGTEEDAGDGAGEGPVKSQEKAKGSRRGAPELRTLHVDIIGKDFWTATSERPGRRVEKVGQQGAHSEGTEAWQDPRRVSNHRGLGLRALER